MLLVVFSLALRYNEAVVSYSAQELNVPEEIETSESGSPIYRHKPRDEQFQFVDQDTEALEKIEEHIGRYIGGQGMVWHELIPGVVHVDIHMLPPTAEHPYHTLVTTGMSDRRANVPPGAEEFQYAEILICLPPDWQLDEKEFGMEENYWPLRWLKILARLPHEYDSWLGYGHTVPNGDPPEPFASNTKLCCALISLPTLFGDDFVQLKVNEEKTVRCLSFIPIYLEEIEFKLKHGSDALFERLKSNGVTELLDINRKNVCV